MLIDVLPIGPIQTNCYVVTCPETRQALVIDPGWPDLLILRVLEGRQATAGMIVNTHTHWDHIGGNTLLKEKTGAPFGIHREAAAMLRAKGGAQLWDIPVEDSPEPDCWLEQGDVLSIGTLHFEVLFTPGHAPGHVSLVEHEQGVVFDGDVLFNRGIGRTDLPGGDHATLVQSIREKLLSLPDATLVYSGHGPVTTIGEERRENPWL